MEVVLRRLHLSALALHASSLGGGARIAITDRDLSVWPLDCRFISTDTLARRNPFPQDARISFVEKTHKYYVDGQEAAISVTSFVHAPFPVFNTPEVIARMSRRTRMEKYPNMEDRAIALAWDANARDASMLGTCMHAALECYANTGVWSRDPRITKEIAMANTFFQKEVYGRGLEVFRTEPTIFVEPSETGFLLPGSVDCILRDPVKDEYWVVDWKRSKEIVLTAGGAYGYGAPPFDKLENTNFFHYSLQLHTYCYILKRFYKLNVNPKHLYMVVIHSNQESYQMIAAANLQHLVEHELMPNFDKYISMAEEHKALEATIAVWKAGGSLPE
jgi:ATP-dependent exoDNAse (exonuclease V) beta subunit